MLYSSIISALNIFNTMSTTFSGSYVRLKVPKQTLPLFVQLKPDNTLHIKLEDMTSEKKNALVTLLKQWFEGLAITAEG